MGFENNIKNYLAEQLNKMGLDIKAESIQLSIPPVKEHGDYSTNVALRYAKQLGKKGVEIADLLADECNVEGVTKVEVAGPGFLNFFVSNDLMTNVVKEILEGEKDGLTSYGESSEPSHKKVDIEYVSANPTGYLHLGHARGAAVGDSLARIMKKAGYDVTREYYINDAGNQIDHMGESLIARYKQRCGDASAEVPEDGYHGQDIVNIAEKLYQEIGDKYFANPEEHIDFFKEYGTKALLDKIKSDLNNFRVNLDVFSSEKAIRKSGRIESCLEKLKPWTYEADGATFLKTKQDGDDKDRVIVKSDGSFTYFLPDIAYHSDKFDRGFDMLVDVFGADHGGYLARMYSAMKSLGYDTSKLNFSLVQIVRLFKGGEEFKMSKRTGNAIAMNDLINEVGVDAVRYFFVARAGTSHLDFDLDLAKSLSSSNPVYYAQYTHARLYSIVEKAVDVLKLPLDLINFDSSLLSSDKEVALMKMLKEYPKRIAEASSSLEPYKIALYTQTLSTAINEWYQQKNAKAIVMENIPLTNARVALAKASMLVLADALNLIGVSAPKHM